MNWTYSESFAGLGAWGKAIQRVSARHNDNATLKYFFEFDKYAADAFCAIHGVDPSLNGWDITKDSVVPKVDIFFYSPPCQTFSISGKREGTTVDKGNLFYAAMQKLEQSKPKFAIMENVKGLPSGDTKADFNAMLWYLESIGYYNYWKVLNTKDYGIPQNRERVFIVSIRSDVYDEGKRFEFPKAIELEKCLHDMLEENVSDKYYLSQKMIDCLVFKDNDFQGEFKPKEVGEIANYLDTREGGRRTNNFIKMDMKVNSATSCGYEVAHPGDSITLEHPNSDTRRGRVGSGVSQTLTTSCNVGYYNGYNIRKLTPIECFRLQGFDDLDYHKAVTSYDKHFTKGKSDTQMYIRAGNSITVNVIEEILENLLYDREQDFQQLSMF